MATQRAATRKTWKWPADTGQQVQTQATRNPAKCSGIMGLQARTWCDMMRKKESESFHVIECVIGLSFSSKVRSFLRNIIQSCVQLCHHLLIPLQARLQQGGGLISTVSTLTIGTFIWQFTLWWSDLITCCLQYRLTLIQWELIDLQQHWTSAGRHWWFLVKCNMLGQLIFSCKKKKKWGEHHATKKQKSPTTCQSLD